MVGSRNIRLIVALCLLAGVASAPAFAVNKDNITVNYNAGHYIDAGGLGLSHTIVALAPGLDVNGADSIITPPPNYLGQPTATRHGNGLPDKALFGMLEYAYQHTDAPNHALAKSAFDANVDALFYWTGPEGPCAGPIGTALFDSAVADTFSGVTPFVNFPACSKSNAWVLWMAAHATVSENMGGGQYVTGYFAWFNGWRDPTISFEIAPFDRSAMSVFGDNGDCDADGITNKEEWQSVMRALGLVAPANDTDWPSFAGLTTVAGWPTSTGREMEDAIIARYIDTAMFTIGWDPEDPDHPPVPQPKITSHTQSQWFEAISGKPLTLSVTVENLVAPITYQWTKDGVAVIDGGRISGAQTATMTITNPDSNDSGIYRCTIEGTPLTKVTLVTPPINILVVPEGGLPVAGLFGLALLGGGLAAAGARRLRNRRK